MHTTPSDARSCLRSFHPTPTAERRLVLFPYAGGNASSYFRLSTLLSETFDVSVVQYPGRLDRQGESPAETIESLAAEAAEALREGDERPLSFFGHSMGAIVAFETARILEGRGQDVRVLFASASPAPSRAGSRVSGSRAEDFSPQGLAEFAGIPPEIMACPETQNLLLAPLRADCRALSGYAASEDASISARVVAFGGTDDTEVGAEALLAWRRATRGGMMLKLFSGGHFYLWDDLPLLVRTVDALAPSPQS
jgi:surfactin synthase thioesterase subunit